MLAGLSAVAGSAMVGGALPLAAQQGKPVVGLRYQNFKRGTIHSLDPATRGLVIVWEDLGRVKLKAADVVANYAPGGMKESTGLAAGLRVGQIVDVQWYDYLDFLIAPMSAETMGQAAAMKAKGAKIEGLPGSAPAIKIWEMDGMITKVDPAQSQIFLIYKSGGEPDRPAPNAGEVIQMPRIVSDAGKAAMAGLKPGMDVVTVWSQQTALKITIIR